MAEDFSPGATGPGQGEERYTRRASAVRRHLFLLCPNNSGSTFLIKALGQCAKACDLPREGQHTFGFAGPSTMQTHWPLIWGGTEESRSHFADPDAYDWERTRRAWYLQARGAGEASVFVTKSPPFLLLADDLRAHFVGTRFLVMVRNPYAALEGILRRRRRSPAHGASDLTEVAARHLLFCLDRQRANAARHADIALAFTYEEMCADPSTTRRGIVTLMPELADLDLQERQSVKQIYDEPLRNMNDEQIARLTSEDQVRASAVFAERAELLGHFGYAVL